MRCVSVLIIDQAQESKGIVANASFVLGLTAGRRLPDSTFGPDVTDGEGGVHCSLTNMAHIVRKAGQSKLRTLRRELQDCDGVMIVDYTEDAAPSDYETYRTSIATKKLDELVFRAIHIFGPEDVVLPRTKNLSALS